MSDLHLPQLRQLFENPRRLEHSEFIVVQAPRKREKVVRDKKRTQETVIEEEEVEIKAEVRFSYTTHLVIYN